MNYYFYVIGSKNRRHEAEAGNCVSRKYSIDQGQGRGGRAGGEVVGGACGRGAASRRLGGRCVPAACVPPGFKAKVAPIQL